MAIPQGHQASPWPFVAMMGMAGCFFLYAASGLLAPWYGVVLLLAGLGGAVRGRVPLVDPAPEADAACCRWSRW